MLASVQHCHANNIVHRDIKMENFLMDITHHSGFKIKLADFGMAAANCDAGRHMTGCGSLINTAPETMVNGGWAYGGKVDVWALGVILHELLSAHLPFYAKNDQQYR